MRGDGVRDLQRAVTELHRLRERLSDVPAEELSTRLTEALTRLMEGFAASQRAYDTLADHHTEERVAELLEGITAIARREFPVEVRVSSRNDAFDAIAVGLNMLAEELAAAMSDRSLLASAITWFQELFGSLPHAVSVLAVEEGPKFRFVMANRAASAAYGRSVADITGRYLEDVLPPEQVESNLAQCRETIAAGATMHYERVDGGEDRDVTLEVTMTPVLGDTGRPTHLVSMGRIKTEAQHTASDDRFEKVQGLLDALAARLPSDLTESAVSLTPREREVLTLIRSGVMSDRELGERLSIAPATARTHVRNILRKSGLHDRRDLMALALSGDH